MRPLFAAVPVLYTILLPLAGVIILEGVRWRVLSKFPQEDHPYRAWVRSIGS